LPGGEICPAILFARMDSKRTDLRNTFGFKRRYCGQKDITVSGKDLYVVSMDEIDRGRNGIKHMNVRNFLLSEELK